MLLVKVNEDKNILFLQHVLKKLHTARSMTCRNKRPGHIAWFMGKGLTVSFAHSSAAALSVVVCAVAQYPTLRTKAVDR